MDRLPLEARGSRSTLFAATPLARIAALADPGSVQPFPPAGASPHLARYGIEPRDDDGISIARVTVHGAKMFVAAQDEHFLGGSVGERQGNALRQMLATARRERPLAIVLLLASGGVRLHEANAAELALARALSALLDARGDGIAVVAVGVGSVFGGTSVLACAADRLAMLPGTRIGLSGPRVLESVHGKWQLDADDTRDVDAVFGSRARTANGLVELIADDSDALRAWVARAAHEREDFRASVLAMHARLASRIAGESTQPPPFDSLPCFDTARPVDANGWLWARSECWLTRPSQGAALGPADAHAIDAALLRHVGASPDDASLPLVLVEDSAGHVVSRGAEMRFVSQFLAHHAAVLALLRHHGRRVIGLLSGVGHSAAFFVNALQAPTLYALASARVVAMEPSALARITGLRAGTLIDDDPLLGQPVRHFAAQGGVATVIPEATLAALGI